MAHSFSQLRQTYPEFRYERADFHETPEGLHLEFHFRMGEIRFAPTHFIPKPESGWALDPASPLVRRLAFCIGMVELISYWKSACPPRVIVEAGPLSAGEISWWRKLYYLGLGEFFYTNGIQVSSEEFLHLASLETAEPAPIAYRLSREGSHPTLIPIGGGKDSVVSLEILAASHATNRLLFINASTASLRCATTAGYGPGQMARTKRTIHPRLLALNAEGFLNGHTPFSAMLAFVSVLVAALHGCTRIALSNESSANESTVPGLPVNHQYSKTFEFEADFQRYVRTWLTPDIHYFSLLRPVNELQISGLLCHRPQYLADFRSCNVGSKQGVWCGQCAKCVFVAAMLSPFLDAAAIAGVFGTNPLARPELLPLLKELTGLAANKPFECVGTVDEVRAALVLAAHRSGSEPPPALIAHMFTHHAELLPSLESSRALLREWNPEHAVPADLLPILQAEVESLRV